MLVAVAAQRQQRTADFEPRGSVQHRSLALHSVAQMIICVIWHVVRGEPSPSIRADLWIRVPQIGQGKMADVVCLGRSVVLQIF